VLLNGKNCVGVSNVSDDMKEAVHVQATAKASGHVLWWFWPNEKQVNQILFIQTVRMKFCIYIAEQYHHLSPSPV